MYNDYAIVHEIVYMYVHVHVHVHVCVYTDSKQHRFKTANKIFTIAIQKSTCVVMQSKLDPAQGS